MQSAHDKSSLSNIAFNLFALKESSPSGDAQFCLWISAHVEIELRFPYRTD